MTTTEPGETGETMHAPLFRLHAHRIHISVTINAPSPTQGPIEKALKAVLETDAADMYAAVEAILKYLDTTFDTWVKQARFAEPGNHVCSATVTVRFGGFDDQPDFDEEFRSVLKVHGPVREAVQAVYEVTRGEAQSWFHELFHPSFDDEDQDDDELADNEPPAAAGR